MDATAAQAQTDPEGEAASEAGVADGQALSPEEEQKRKFREALEAKRGGGAKGGSGPGDASKIHGSSGRAGAKRQFRRKSGG